MFRKWKMATSLMEWMMILVRSSSSSSSIKHTVAAIKEKGGNSIVTGFGI
jgi:tripartite-type tricarboxylate transporter receptor subunit TctC